MKTNKKSNIQNIKKIFILNYKTSLEGLNSSLAQSAGELWPVVKNTHGYIFFVGLEFLSNFLFLSHNFGSRYVMWPIKPSKDTDDSLVSKKTCPRR